MPSDSEIRRADSPSRWKRVLPLGLVALSLAVTAPGFGNQFVQDDLPLILKNETIHSLAQPEKFFTTPYWHDPFPPALYRPLATTALAVQWKAGGGNPAVYRWVSTALLAGAAIALFELAALLLPLAAAAAVATLFVVHPVHVEANALGVNQGELAVALLLCWATAVYIRTRRKGDLPPATAAGVILLFAAAGLFKEHALVLPGMLLAAELFLIADPRPFRVIFRRVRPFYLLLVVVALAILAARSAVLGGDLVGTFTADGLTGAGPMRRAVTMVGVVPEWTRLLLWPAHLQADYGPDELLPASGGRAMQWAGAVLLAGAVILLLTSRRKLPVLAFGICWIAIAIFPVSNVLVPTGILLAERTLFLATAGAVLGIGALVSLARTTAARWIVLSLVGMLVVLGTLRSRSRERIWHDQGTLLRATVLDAPRSYAAHLALARFLEDSGSTGDAARAYRNAVAIRPSIVDRDRALADQYRRAGFCRPAVRLYRRALIIAPDDSATRASLLACGDSGSSTPVP